MPSWDTHLSTLDREVVAASGYGRRGAMGQRVALLIIDVTYAFCGDSPEPILDSIKRFRNSSGERAWEAVAHIASLLSAARAAAAPVVYTRGMSRASTVAPGRWASKNLRSSEDAEWHHEIVREIGPAEGEVILRKSKPSAFFGTPLTSILVDKDVDSLVVCGGTTSGCVRATVVDAFSYNYSVSVVEPACFDRIGASHDMSLFDMDLKYADVVSTLAAVELFGSHQQPGTEPGRATRPGRSERSERENRSPRNP